MAAGGRSPLPDGPSGLAWRRAFSARANLAADTIFIDDVILAMFRIDLRLMSTACGWRAAWAWVGVRGVRGRWTVRGTMSVRDGMGVGSPAAVVWSLSSQRDARP